MPVDPSRSRFMSSVTMTSLLNPTDGAARRARSLSREILSGSPTSRNTSLGERKLLILVGIKGRSIIRRECAGDSRRLFRSECIQGFPDASQFFAGADGHTHARTV